MRLTSDLIFLLIPEKAENTLKFISKDADEGILTACIKININMRGGTGIDQLNAL